MIKNDCSFETMRVRVLFVNYPDVMERRTFVTIEYSKGDGNDDNR